MEDLQGYIILFLVWLVSTLLVRAIFTKTRTTARLPPSPLRLPIIGHLHLIGSIPHQALHKLSNRYGPLMHLYFGSVPCLVVSSPEFAREVLKTNEASFSNRPYIAAHDNLTYGSADFSFSPAGPYWRFMKKLVGSEILSRRILDQFHPVRRDEEKQFLQLMLKKAKAGEAVDLEGQLIRMSNNIISRMMMRQRCSENEDEAGSIRKVVQETTELIGRFNLSDFIGFCKNLDLQGFGKRVKEVHDRFEKLMERIVKEHEETRRKKKEMGGDGCDNVKDVLDILLDIQKDESSEMKLTRENVKAFILDIFVAGTDAIALTTEWALAELINHPHVMEKARQEIDSVVGKSRIVEESDIANLPYIQAIFKETLRLHTAGPLVVRESSEKSTIGGYEIPAKTRLLVNVWAISRDPKNWENPLEFRPERFISEEGSVQSKLDVRGQQFHFLPFGSGKRGCPGIPLAQPVVQTTLAAMIQCFEWKVGDGENSTVDMEEGPGLTLPRAHPLVCVPVARLTPFPSV